MTSQRLSDKGWRIDAVIRSSCLLVVVALAVVLMLPEPVAAFANPADYGNYPTDDPTTLGGGAGRFFTGSPADGYGCDVCHSAAQKYSFPIQHKGFPLDGYVPGKEYKIELSWPLATAAEAQALAQGLMPATELIAEFVSEEGGSAGTVKFAASAELDPSKFPGLFCAAPPGTAPEDRVYAMSMFANEPGKPVLELTLDDIEENGDSCTVGGEEDDDLRCILAMSPCGAQSVKFLWTAPEQWRGPIWFSAGFVTTYDQTSEPNDADYVTLLALPMNPSYEGGTYKTVLDTGCAVLGGPRARAARSGWLLVFASALLLLSGAGRRRWLGSRGRAVLPLAAVIVLLLCSVGCSDKGSGLVTGAPAPVGLYEPTACPECKHKEIPCRMGAWPDAGMPMASTPADVADPASGAVAPTASGAGAGTAGAAGAAGAGTAGPAVMSLGTVMFDFTSAQPAGVVSGWQSKCGGDCYYLAAWIENDAGAYVRTLLQPTDAFYAATTLHEYYGLGKDCLAPAEMADLVSMATPIGHRPYMLKWDGLLGNGSWPAPEGTYHLRMEMSLDENPAHKVEVADIPFMFGGPAPLSEMLPPMPPHAGLTLAYTPTP